MIIDLIDYFLAMHACSYVTAPRFSRFDSSQQSMSNSKYLKDSNNNMIPDTRAVCTVKK